jgi:Spy/CpxP family protein refolding chaperone
MKRKWITVAIVTALLSAAAWAQPYPGMMGGGGPGMAGGQAGCPMMGGGGGPGGGPGMMGGRGGPGMMGGFGPGGLAALDLTDEQRAKIEEIRHDQWRKHHAITGSMMELRWQSSRSKGSESEAEALKNYDAMAALRRQMFQSSFETRKRIEAVLTKEQKEKLGK